MSVTDDDSDDQDPSGGPDPSQARWLTGDAGRAAVTHATALLDDGTSVMATVAQLRRIHGPAGRVAAIVAAAEARRRARDRWADADRLLFTRTGLEQASDPAVSRWRAARFAQGNVFDLCAGIGGDTIALARVTSRLVAVDRDAARAALLEHNLGVLGLDAQVEIGDVLQRPLPTDALIHIDPSRRRGERRRIDPDHGSPPLRDVLAVHGDVAGIGFVCAPGVDTDHPSLPADAEVEYIQLGDRLVEAVVWTGTLRRDRATARATLLDPRPDASSGSLEDLVRAERWRAGERTDRLVVGALGSHLLDAAPAAIRARLHDEIGRTIGARRIANRRALLTVDDQPPACPWYRARPVLAQLPARPRAVRAWLADRDPGPVEIVLHGVEADPRRWWQELGRPPRGPSGVRVELIRRDDDAIAVVTDASSR